MREEILALVQRHLNMPRVRFSGQNNLSLKCPFHKGGQESSASFSVNVENGLFNCFTCHVTGNLPTLLRLLGLTREQIDMETEHLRDWLNDNRTRAQLTKRARLREDPFLARMKLRESILKAYDLPPGVGPASLVQAGFREDWLRYLEVGFDRMNNRITYPIRDLYGNFAGVVGGAVFTGVRPKYKVYEGKRTDPWTKKDILSDFGPWFDEEYPGYTFKNHDFLWNIDRVYPRMFWGKEVDQTIIIVEGFKACMWLLQNGWWNTIALMGSSISDQQLNHLLRLKAHVVLFLDNNEAGREGSLKAAHKLIRTHGVSFARYPSDADDECQPDDLSAEELVVSVTSAWDYPEYMRGAGSCRTTH